MSKIYQCTNSGCRKKSEEEELGTEIVKGMKVSSCPECGFTLFRVRDKEEVSGHEQNPH